MTNTNTNVTANNTTTAKAFIGSMKLGTIDFTMRKSDGSVITKKADAVTQAIKDRKSASATLWTLGKDIEVLKNQYSMSLEDIAEKLDMSLSTVKAHSTAIGWLKKFGYTLDSASHLYQPSKITLACQCANEDGKNIPDLMKKSQAELKKLHASKKGSESETAKSTESETETENGYTAENASTNFTFDGDKYVIPMSDVAKVKELLKQYLAK